MNIAYRSSPIQDPIDGTPGQPLRRHLPGEPGIWLVVLGDLGFFGVLFAIFLVARATESGVFHAGERALSIDYGAVMTLVLLTSSLFVVFGVQAIRMGMRAAGWFGGALLCGAIFVGLKVFEWNGHVNAEQTLSASHFWNFYYALTGMHLLHVLVGMLALAYVLVESRKPVGARPLIKYVESAACFWHLVDLLWIMIFAFLYVLR